MARKAHSARAVWSWYIAGLMTTTAAHGAPGDTAGQGSTSSGPTLPVLLAQMAPRGVAPAPYLVSEKLDGVRALWDGQQLRFRSGRVVPAPAWFLAQLPAEPLDGELWLGRGRFDALSAIVRKAVALDDDWRQLRYMVFDLPGGAGSFASRTERLKALLERTPNPQLVWVEQKRLDSAQALQHWLADVATQGGEGLMLHRADALIVSGRSDALLKLKPQQDTEATITGYRPGKGKYRGQTGALQLRTDAGVEFALGTGLSDALRRDPPAIGSVVTYRFRGVTPTGKPRFASFLRVRENF